MPYIKQEVRNILDSSIDKLAIELVDVNNDNLCGELNYSIFRIIKCLTDSSKGGKLSYARFNAIIGALECCKQEIYRRMISPYEDRKIEENGDI